MDPEQSQRIHARELVARLRNACIQANDHIAELQEQARVQDDALLDLGHQIVSQRRSLHSARIVATVAVIVAVVLAGCVLHLRHGATMRAVQTGGKCE